MLFQLATLAATVATATATQTSIGGYVPGSNVVPHSQIDLDVQAMITDTGSAMWADAWHHYAKGGNSVKGSGAIRTVRGFSTAFSKMEAEPLFKIYKKYWGAGDYADTFVTQALNNTGYMLNQPDVVRHQVAMKGSQYQVTWMYVVHEMEDALSDCAQGNVAGNDGGVHAFDEAWAFYAGSLVGTDASNIGVMAYALAEKRCKNFGTCTGSDGKTGKSKVNTDLLKLYDTTRDQLAAYNCAGATTNIATIKQIMSIPLIQGGLRYAYKADPKGGNEGDKAWAEGWAFAAAILPQIDNCNAANAKIIKDNQQIQGLSSATSMKDGYKAVANAYYNSLHCLKLNCSDIGSLSYAGQAEADCNKLINPVPKPNSAAGLFSGVAALAMGAVATLFL